MSQAPHHPLAARTLFYAILFASSCVLMRGIQSRVLLLALLGLSALILCSWALFRFERRTHRERPAGRG
jgi:hypothetical protein